MSYAIFTPVFGIPLINRNGDEISEEVQDLLDAEKPGFITQYASSVNSIAFGVVVGKPFNECFNHVEMSEMVLTVLENDLEKFSVLYQDLTLEIRQEMEKFGEPRLFYLCSSS